MSSKAILILLPIAFLWGASAGHNNSPEPKVVTQVKIVRVPEVITHVETKTITGNKPLPESCKEILKTLKVMDALDDTTAGSVGKLTDEISTATERLAMKDIIGVNNSAEIIGRLKWKLDTAIIAKVTAVNLSRTQLEACQKETK